MSPKSNDRHAGDLTSTARLRPSRTQLQFGLSTVLMLLLFLGALPK